MSAHLAHELSAGDDARLLRSVLAAAAAPVDVGPQPGEDAAMADFHALRRRTRPRRKHVQSKRTSTRIATVTVAAGLVLVGAGAASAATGLPSGAADAAQAALTKLGITVGAGDHGKPATTPTAPTGGDSGSSSEVSQLATTTDLTGVDKGAAISGLASDGKSQAGQHGASDAKAAARAAAAAHATSHGTTTAATASGGHSTDGSAHAVVPPTRP